MTTLVPTLPNNNKHAGSSLLRINFHLINQTRVGNLTRGRIPNATTGTFTTNLDLAPLRDAQDATSWDTYSKTIESTWQHNNLHHRVRNPRDAMGVANPATLRRIVLTRRGTIEIVRIVTTETIGPEHS